MEKEDFGYTPILHQHYVEKGKLPKGTFQIKERNENFYWYFTLSKGKNRTRYICSVKWDGDISDSFSNAIDIASNKLSGKKTTHNTLVDVINQYLKELKEEGEEDNPSKRTKKTIADISYHIRKFKEFVSENKISLNKIENKSFRKDFKEFIQWLEKDYSKQSVRVILTHARQFLDYLVNPTYKSGYIERHFITSDFISKEFSIRRNQSTDSEGDYSKENYDEILKILSKKAREIWIDWVNNPRFLERKKSAVFTSFLQLLYGFRISELVECYLSGDIKNENHNSKSGYSYIERSDGDIFIHVYKKRKYGLVLIDFDISSWSNEPPEYVDYYDGRKSNHKKPSYKTNILDSVIHMFGNERQIISSHSSEMFGFIKKYVIEEMELYQHGIQSSHDFRDFFINYNLNELNTPIEVDSEVVRHNVSTLQKYYRHRNKEISKERARKMQTSKLYKDV